MTTPEEAAAFADSFIKSLPDYEEDEEATAFADKFIKSLPGYEEVMADPTMKRIEKIGNDARTAFYAQFGPVPVTNSSNDIARRRSLEEGGKLVYEAAMTAALKQELEEFEQLKKELQDEDENAKKEKEEELSFSLAELRAKLKELSDGDEGEDEK